MPRRAKGWKAWSEPSGANHRCRWTGRYGSGQLVFVQKADRDEYLIAKKRDFQRMDAGLPPMLADLRRPGFERFRDDYLLWLEQRRSKRTRYITGRALALYEEHAGAAFPSRADVRKFSDWLLTRFHPNAARIYLRHLKAAFRWAHKESIIDYDPFQYFEFPAAVQVARLVRPEDVKTIMRELPEIVRQAVFFVLYSGLRLSEVLALDWSGIKKVGGKWYLTVLKSKTRRAKAEYKTQAIHPRALAVIGQPKRSGRIFPITPSRLEQNLRRAVVKLGLGRVRLHDLRHTWATALQQRVRDLRSLMEVGGWASVQAAMIYQHGTPQRQDATLGLRYEGLAPIQPLNGGGRDKAGKRETLKK